MLSQKHRLTRSLFMTVLTRGKSYHSPHLSLKVAVLPPDSGPRFSVVISKKSAKSSPKRHLFRRRLYELLRSSGAVSHTRSIGGIMFAKKDAAGLSFAALEEEVVQLLKAARVI